MSGLTVASAVRVLAFVFQMLFCMFVYSLSHGERHQAGRGGSRRGGDDCQGSRFQSISIPAENTDTHKQGGDRKTSIKI